MNDKEVTIQLDLLIGAMSQLVDLQKVLEEAVREKLAAMRRCDSDGMMAAAAREGELTLKIRTLDDKRRDISTSLADALNIPIPADISNLTLRVLASHLDEEGHSRVMKIGQALRERMLRVAEANRVVEIVCREMMAHFRTIFTAFTRDGETSRNYSRGGQVEPGVATQVLDAVG